MLQKTSSTLLLLVLLFGASGCIVHDRDDWRRHRYGHDDRRYGDDDRDRDRDCWREGDRWVCRR